MTIEQSPELDSNAKKIAYHRLSLKIATLFGISNPTTDSEANELMTRAINHLTPREQELITARYPSTSAGITLQEFADQKGVSKQRVSQVEAKIFKKIAQTFLQISNNSQSSSQTNSQQLPAPHHQEQG